jgi:hypothetical protein
MALIEIREDKAHRFPNGDYDLDTQHIIEYRNFYSEEFFEELFSQLGIVDRDHQYEFLQAVCSGAWLYDAFKGLNIEENTQQFQKDRLSKLQTALNKSKNSLNDLSENFFGYPQFLMRELSTKIRDRSIKKDFITKKLKKFITNKPSPDEYVSHLVCHIDFILEAIKGIENENLHLDRSKGRTALARWVNKIGETWILYSEVPYIAGAYYKNTGYNSEALIILTQIIQKVDPSIEGKNIATELRRFGKVNFE